MTVFKKAFALLGRKERTNAAALIFLMIVSVILETLGVSLVIPALAVMQQGDIGARYPRLQPTLSLLGNPTQSQLLLGAMLALVAIYVIKNSYFAFLTWRQTRFAFNFQTELSERLFALYLRQPYAFHLRRNSAQLMTNVTGEVGTCALVLNNAMSLITEVMVLLAIAALLLAAEPLGALIVVVVLGSAGWGFHHATRARITRWGEARQFHATLSIQHLQQGLGGAKDVKLTGREQEFVAQFSNHYKAHARVGGLQTVMQQLPRLGLELLAVFGMAILVETMLFKGRDLTVVVGTVGLFAAAAFRLIPSANRIIAAMQILRFNVPAINTVYSELQLSSPEIGKREKGTSCEFKHEITVANVTYIYPEAPTTALVDLSIKIRKGESVGLIGSSGSGKSTTVDLILGLLTPSLGQISVDGQSIQSRLRGWQDQIGYVPQSIYLTDDTLRRNVAFGLPDAQINDEAIRRAIDAAQLGEFVSILPEGLETIVGERGVRLSGGQLQRIGIARALYHDPSVLVLDEATSALDATTEALVMESVSALKGSKTILIVAHRLSTIERCDRLYRLENGRVVAEGTPRELGIGSTSLSGAT